MFVGYGFSVRAVDVCCKWVYPWSWVTGVWGDCLGGNFSGNEGTNERVTRVAWVGVVG